MNWLYLVVGIIMQSLCVTCLRLSNGFTALLPTVLAFVFWAVAFSMLTFLLKGSDLSHAFAIYAGSGVVVVAAIGFAFLNEQVTVLKLVAIALVSVGVVCLNWK